MTSTNELAISFYDALGYTDAGCTMGSEVQREGKAFSMTDVERRLLRKSLTLRDGRVAPAPATMAAATTSTGRVITSVRWRDLS